MGNRRLRPVLLLSAWTVLVWTTRIRNIWTDESLTVGAQVWRTALAVVFTGFAAVAFAAWMKARRRGFLPRGAARWVRAFVVWTIVVWAVRAVQIGMADHDVGFKVVHTVLAAVSVGLALWADRAANAAPRSEAVDA